MFEEKKLIVVLIVAISYAFGMALDVIVYAFVAAIIYFFLLVVEGMLLIIVSDKDLFLFYKWNFYNIFRRNWRQSWSCNNAEFDIDELATIWRKTKKVTRPFDFFSSTF